LDDFEQRIGRNQSSEAIRATLQERLQQEVPKAVVNIFGAPPVEGLGTAGGFKIIVQDTNDNGLPALQESAEHVLAAGESDPHLQGLFTSFRADTPWLELIIDRAQAKDRGVSIDDVRTTLESTIGPYYVNDFNRFGRTWQVNVQAQETFRQSAEDVKQLKVRNAQGEMVPLAVILVVPMCLLCAIVGVVLARMDVNVFTQVGFLVLVGLACKNAILIVEFAKAQREAGRPRAEATLAACELRLRPIIMTSFAFILGVVPLILSEGAGAEMRRTLGTAVFSGMLGVTLFG